MKVAVFQYSLFGVNTYVVYDGEGGECAVIDPAPIDRQEENALTGFIEKHHLTVTQVINTHQHIDHCIGNGFVRDRYGVAVKAHKGDDMLGRNLRRQVKMYGLPLDVTDAGVTDYLEDGDKVKIGSGELEVIHVPGHSPGSIVLYDRADGFIIAGDVLFSGSIGRTDLPGGDYDTLINGIREKLLPLPDSTVVYSGHGPSTTIGRERLSNPFLL